jgi:hypothetical protein
MRRIIRNVRAKIDRVRSSLRLVGWHRKSSTAPERIAVLPPLQISPLPATGRAMDPGGNEAQRSCTRLPRIHPVVAGQVLPQLGSRSTGTRSGTENRRHGGHPTLSVDTPQNRGEGDYRGWGLGGMGDGNATSASSLRSAASGAGQHAPGAHSLRSFVPRQVRVAQLHLRLVDSSDLREGNQGSIDPVNGRSAVPGDQGNRSDAQGDPRERRMSSSWETVRTQYQALKTISRLTGRAVWVHAVQREDTPQASIRKAAKLLRDSLTTFRKASGCLQDRFSFGEDPTPIPTRTNRLVPAKLATAMASWAASKVWP